jgi:NADH-quinone oxidoreductase subunit M
MGLWSAENVAWYYPWIAMISATGIIVTAAYVLRVVQRVFFGELKPEFADLPGINFLDKTALFILSGILILVGVYPKIMMSLIEVGVAPLAALFGGA